MNFNDSLKAVERNDVNLVLGSFETHERLLFPAVSRDHISSILHHRFACTLTAMVFQAGKALLIKEGQRFTCPIIRGFVHEIGYCNMRSPGWKFKSILSFQHMLKISEPVKMECIVGIFYIK